MGDQIKCFRDDLPDNFCDHTNGNVTSPSKEHSLFENGEQELQVMSITSEICRDIDHISGPRARPHRSFLFRAKELRSSIIASETTRTICSVVIALVVVLSFIDRPLIGINIVHSKSIVAMRPLYILLVTEFTVLFVHLVIVRRSRIDDEDDDFQEHRSSVVSEGGLNWERAVRVLERGLVAHQMIRSFFIDFSVYVVIVVCALSLAQR